MVAGEVNLKTFLIPKEAWHQQQSEEELEAALPADVRAAGELTRKEWKKQTKKERQKHWVESSNEDRKGTTLISSIANNTAAHRLGDVRHMLVSDTRDGWEKYARTATASSSSAATAASRCGRCTSSARSTFRGQARRRGATTSTT